MTRPAIIEQLLDRAIDARQNAYAPYSNYQVGAAVLGKNGEIYHGCNVENDSFRATVCAERVALYNAISEGARHFEIIAIATANAAPPCGICLQTMLELCREVTILITNLDKSRVRETSLSALLPCTQDVA